MDRLELQRHAQSAVYGTNGPPPQSAQYHHHQPPAQAQQQFQPQPKTAAPPQDRFCHIRNLPVFPIHAQSDTDALIKAYNQIQKRRQPTFDVHAPLANGSAALSQNLRTTPRINLVLTRYSSLHDCSFPGIIVDVIETRGKSSWQGNGIRLRASRECTILVRDKWKIRLKAGSMWSKNANWKPVETMSVEDEKDTLVTLTNVERWTRMIAVAERQEVWRRFEKDYKTPEVPGVPASPEATKR